MKRVEVAVGVIRKDNQIYISKRADALHMGGKWEFPGGKKEQNETMEQALVRELKEEVGIDVLSQREMMVINFDYPDKQVSLDIRIVEKFAGEPEHKEGQLARWVAIEELHTYEFPEANRVIVNKLQAEKEQN